MIIITIFIFYLRQFHLCFRLSLHLNGPLTFPPLPVAAEGSSRLLQTSEAAAERTHYRSAGRPWVSPGRTAIEQTTLMTTLSSRVCLLFFFFLNKIYSVVVCVAVGTGYKHTGDPKSRATEGEESQRCDNCLRLAIWSRKYQRADPTSQRSKIKLVPSRLNCNQTRIQCFDQVNWTHGSLPGIPFLIMYNFLLRKFFWNRN